MKSGGFHMKSGGFHVQSGGFQMKSSRFHVKSVKTVDSCRNHYFLLVFHRVHWEGQPGISADFIDFIKFGGFQL